MRWTSVCPACEHHGMAVIATIYDPHPAPGWLKLVSLGLVRMVRARVGYMGLCAHCGEKYHCGDGGPRDTWRERARKESVPRGTASTPEPGPGYDPARDAGIRTERDFARR